MDTHVCAGIPNHHISTLTDTSRSKEITVGIRTDRNLRDPGVTRQTPTRDGNTVLFHCVVRERG
jgi:hypothetical protein